MYRTVIMTLTLSTKQWGVLKSRSGGKAPRIFITDTKYMATVPLPFCFWLSPGSSPLWGLHSKVGGPQRQSGAWWRKELSCSAEGNRSAFLLFEQSVALSLHWLSYIGFRVMVCLSTVRLFQTHSCNHLSISFHAITWDRSLRQGVAVSLSL
jgi:hypothetical protein